MYPLRFKVFELGIEYYLCFKAQTLNISDIQLFNLLKSKFGDKEAEQFVAVVKHDIEKGVNEKHQIITKDISILRDELYKNFATKADIAESKSDMIKWMFIIVFSSTLLTIVSILAIVRFFLR